MCIVTLICNTVSEKVGAAERTVAAHHRIAIKICCQVMQSILINDGRYGTGPVQKKKKHGSSQRQPASQRGLLLFGPHFYLYSQWGPIKEMTFYKRAS
jgi:hypothetical protein